MQTPLIDTVTGYPTAATVVVNADLRADAGARRRADYQGQRRSRLRAMTGRAKDLPIFAPRVTPRSATRKTLADQIRTRIAAAYCRSAARDICGRGQEPRSGAFPRPPGAAYFSVPCLWHRRRACRRADAKNYLSVPSRIRKTRFNSCGSLATSLPQIRCASPMKPIRFPCSAADGRSSSRRRARSFLARSNPSSPRRRATARSSSKPAR